MECIDRDLKDVFPGLTQDRGEGGPNGSRLFEELATQACAALSHFHSSGVTHKDLKADNIRFAPGDESFVVVDFGFASHLDSDPGTREALIVKEQNDFEADLLGRFTLMDILQLSRVLEEVFSGVAHHYDDDRATGIHSVFRRAQAQLDERFQTAEQFIQALQPYFLHLGRSNRPFVLRLNEHLTSSLTDRFSSKLRIPVSGSILLTDRVRRIIDTAEFQRLRGVKQLGPTAFVFPGATHTRFEHSLGAYWLTLRYLERVARSPQFRSFHPNHAEALKLAVLSALLHDIGHYPYSHWVEELGLEDLPGHEERALERILESEIGQLIREDWGLEPESVACIILSTATPVEHTTLNSLIDSPIDVDKVDYLIRDSVHCGVEYGRGIDVDRLLDSLHVDPDNGRLCVTDRGRSAVVSIIGARNLLYQEVYWHKTVRACQAMFKRFFFEYVEQEIRTMAQIKRALLRTDEAFLSYLATARGMGKKSPLWPLISPFLLNGRRLYKAAFVYSRAAEKAKMRATSKFFQDLNGRSYRQTIELGNSLADHFGIPHLELLLETVPVKAGEEYMLEGFRVFRHRAAPGGRRPEDLPTSVTQMNAYLKENRRSFVFCSESHYKRLRSLSVEQWNAAFQHVLKVPAGQP